jgi:hypothetical protein
MLISTALLLDSIIRNSVCTPAKLPCRRVVEGEDWEMFFIQTIKFAQIMLVQVVLKNYLSSILLILSFWCLFNGQSLEEIV